MVLGGNGDSIDSGGRYGSVGESSGLMQVHTNLIGGGGCSGHTKSRSSGSSITSEVMVADLDDPELMAQECYQRSPLMGTTDADYLQNAGATYRNGNGYIGNGEVKISMPSPLRSEPRFPQERLKTVIAFIFLFGNWILTTAFLALTHERVPQDAPLPDIYLDNVHTEKWGLKVSEILIIVSMYACVLVILFHKHRYIIFRRIFLMMGLLYFYRSITMYVTVLPVADPTYYCSPKANFTSATLIIKRVVQLMSGFGLSINGQHTFCGDYIYSGHTVCLVIAYLIIREYTPRRWWLLHWMFALMAVTGVVMVLTARGHYTVDCIIAYYITTRLFYIYHTMANNQQLKDCGTHNYFERLWWYPIFNYFECNVRGVVPRHYEWPLPWPRRWGIKSPQRTS